MYDIMKGPWKTGRHLWKAVIPAWLDMQHKGQLSKNRQAAIVVAACICTVFTGCGNAQSYDQGVPSAVPNVVTSDIQAGIEKHIDDKARAGEGYFKFSSGGKEYSFKLVRVHTEFLANLGPRRHFACVDLVDTEGDVYDVDFFLSGDPGAMTVTETTLHKFNGIPFYAWEEKEDHTWVRVPVEEASQKLLGVITEQDDFEFLYAVTLPKIRKSARMWLPLPVTDSFQKVEVLSIKAPGKHRTLKDNEHGNKALFFELGPKDSGKLIEIRYQVERIEKSAYPSHPLDIAKHLNAERLVPNNNVFRSTAQKVLEGKKGDLVRARALYDHVIKRMRYMKYGTGWGKGDAVYACDARTGNCSDYHAYFIALARAAGIPARFGIGVTIPSERNEGGIDGYHCWAEFHAEGKWWPVDISEADKYEGLSTYYFGHHPANRFEFSHGRDLVLEPSPASGPLNFLAYPVLEIGGKTAKAKVAFSFKRTVSGT